MTFTAEDRGDHYLVDEGDGPFRVSKVRLDADLEGRIRQALNKPAAPIVTTLPVVPQAVSDFFRNLYPKAEHADESVDAGPEEDEPDAEVQTFADGGLVGERGATGALLWHPDEVGYGANVSAPARYRPTQTELAEAVADRSKPGVRTREEMDAVIADLGELPNLGTAPLASPKGFGAGEQPSAELGLLGDIRERRRVAALDRVEKELAAPARTATQTTLGDMARGTAPSSRQGPRTQAPLEPPQAMPDIGFAPDVAPVPGGVDGSVGGSQSFSMTTGPGMNDPVEFEPDPIYDTIAKQKADSVISYTKAAQDEAEDLEKNRLDKASREARAAEAEVKAVAEHGATLKAMSDDIKNTKIDPGHFYGNLSTGQKVSAVASIILGGLASTLSGIGRGGPGTNVGMALLQRAAEKDVDAQKANLANKHSTYRALVQQGHDDASARKIALGYDLSAIAAQLEAIQAKHAGSKFAAQLGMTIAGINLEAQKNIIAGIKSDIDNTYKPMLYEAQIAKDQQERFGATQSARASMEAAYADEEMLRRFQEKRATDADWRAISSNPKRWGKITEKMVQLPNGAYGIYNGSIDGVEKLKEKLGNIKKARSTLTRLMDIAKANEKARLGGMRVPFTKDNASVLSRQAVLDIVKGSGLGAWDKGLEDLLNVMIVDPNSWFSLTSSNIQALETIIESGDLETQRLLDDNLSGTKTGRSTSRKEE